MRSVSLKGLSAGLFLAILLPACLQAQDQVTVTVTILDAVTGEPIQGVHVSVEDVELEMVSNSTGVLVFSDIRLGPHQLTLHREGYDTESGRLLVDKGGEMVIRMNPIGGPPSSAMSRVPGRIRDADGGGGLEGAAVSLSPLGLVKVTDSHGRFSFQDVPPGEYNLTVELLGYATRDELVRVEGGKILTLDLTLAVEPIELDPIEVSVEARNLDLEISGFYQRREATSGYFITREKIEERAPLYTTDLFRGMAGVKVIGALGMGTQKAVLLTGSRDLSFGGGRCWPAVWMDGQMVHQGSASPVPQGPAFLDQLIHPDDIAGIEIYNSAASMPIQYNLHGGCGVIVLWTRYGR
jgi:hypothetical protein